VVSTVDYFLKNEGRRVSPALSSTDLATRMLSPQLNLNRTDLSRAFVNEDAGGTVPRRNYALPARDDPAFDAAAAVALLEAARAGETASAEDATGYYWGERRLHEHVRRIRGRAEAANDDRLVQLADRFLR
jgi:hypothetical protein